MCLTEYDVVAYTCRMPKRHSNDAEWVNAADAGRYLSVSQSTLYRWEKSGDLVPARTPSGQKRYRVSDLDQILSDDSRASA